MFSFICVWSRDNVDFRSVLGDRLTFDVIVRHTFFDHFCGGTSGASIQSTVNRLQQQNVGAILDYAAEADVDPTPKQGIISARSYECARLLVHHWHFQHERRFLIDLTPRAGTRTSRSAR